jgi:membrane protein
LTFFALLSATPFLLALVSIYGLVADASTVETEVLHLSAILPEDARALVAEQLHAIVGLSVTQLEIGAVVSIAGGIWGGSKGSFYLFRALNQAYGETESRRLLTVKLMAFAFTLLIAISGVIALALVALLPGLMHLLGLDAHAEKLIDLGRWPAVAVLASVLLALLYRFGPNRRSPRLRWLSLGSATAVVTWLVSSYLFSAYVSRFGDFNQVYGSLAGIIILMLWLYLSAFLILLGAVIDAERAQLMKRATLSAKG